MAPEYVHQELNQEVTAIGGRFVLVREVRLPFRGREVLCLVGHAAFDTACCGVGGCAYALVPGFILTFRDAMSEDGQAVSQVEPIDDGATQEGIRRLITEKEVVHQVVFQ